MTYALFSDLHADEVGLAKLQKHTAFQNADNRVCLGDAINVHDEKSAQSFYRKVRSICDDMVVGNHEAVLTGACDISLFNPKWHESILESKKQLEEKQPEFIRELKKLPASLTLGEAVARHASFDPKSPWQHVRYTEDVQSQADYLPAQVHFLGHGHIPYIAWKSEGFWYYQRQIYDKLFRLDPKTQYVINIGSILGSREMRKFEKTFLVYDTKGTVTFYNLGEAL